jgi:hypothetical protein
MNLIGILLFTVLMHVSLTANSQLINFSGNKVPLKTVFESIKSDNVNSHLILTTDSGACK